MKSKPQHKIAVLTGGGDAQGMNAALRAVSRMAISKGWKVYGVKDGFYGLFEIGKCPDFESNPDRKYAIEMSWETMSWAIREGGSWLGTIRCEQLKQDKSHQEKIVRKLIGAGINSIVVIGGDGSLRGGYALSEAAKRINVRFSVVVVPASIDNDIPNTEVSIGVDTALNVIVSCIDKLSDTSAAVNRVIIAETMGRDCGYLATFGALASGAEQVFIPESKVSNRSIEELLQELRGEYRQGRRYGIVVVGEGAALGASPTDFIEKYIQIGKQEEPEGQGNELPWDIRKAVLGHLQRGGPTSAFDRILATRMGAKAVELLASKDSADTPQMVALQEGGVVGIPVKRVIENLKDKKHAVSNERLLEIAGLVRNLSSMPKKRKTPEGTIAVITAGADAPGMNMILRGVSRYAKNNYGLNTWGFKNGYSGLINGKKMQLSWEIVTSAGNRTPTRRAGAILGTGTREDAFTNGDMQKILSNLGRMKNLRGLIVIGGLSTALRAAELSKYFEKNNTNIPIVVVPASIDHGLPATHATVGFDSALNVIMEACDNITDTGQATSRVSVVETMGGGVGALALMGAVAAGAELALISEDIRSDEDARQALAKIKEQMKKSRRDFATVIVKEKLYENYTLERLGGIVKGVFETEARTTDLGYVQRGGHVSSYDRVLGTLMGVEAVKTLMTPPVRSANMLRSKKGIIEAIALDQALERGVQGWTKGNRMEKAKSLWRYDEIKTLFEGISILAAPRVSDR